VDRSSADPPYAQLVAQIRAAIDGGSLAPGTRLPTVRALATQIGLVPNTVAKAYRRLETCGYLEGRGRAGTFVPDRLPVSDDAADAANAADALAAAARAYLERARRLGADPGTAVEAVRRAAPKG
jgi:DNA-binding transcriptional regulator YhcF (GntR family)